jgi:hypothetical protein
LTWVTAGTTAVAAVTGGWPFADVIALCRPDSKVLSAAVCDGYADFASVTNADALVLTLVSAVCKELRPFVATSTFAEVLDGGLELADVGAVGGLAAASGGQPGQDQGGGRR